MQGRVALMSYHTQRSCGHEWERKRGRFPAPALYIYIYIYMTRYSPAPGRIKVAARGDIYILSLLLDTVNVYCDFLLIIYIYIYLSIYTSLYWVSFFVSVLLLFLHVWYIPPHQFDMLFRASVLLMSVRQDDMSPSGNTFLGRNLDVRLDLWIYTF